MIGVKTIVLDALKPRETTIIDLSRALCNVPGVLNVVATVREVDERTETVRIKIEGRNIDYDMVLEAAKEVGTAIRSIDEVSVEKIEGEV
ncbi:MAG TPA: hypothetical protein ENF42_02625 [Candidatus Bathyarchaeota archaeon]|nr:hypothetical protein [Candidatus Bathyarchaeota archaeon]